MSLEVMISYFRHLMTIGIEVHYSDGEVHQITIGNKLNEDKSYEGLSISRRKNNPNKSRFIRQLEQIE